MDQVTTGWARRAVVAGGTRTVAEQPYPANVIVFDLGLGTSLLKDRRASGQACLTALESTHRLRRSHRWYCGLSLLSIRVPPRRRTYRLTR